MKYSNLLFVLAAAMLFSLSALAQEEATIIEGPDPLHREVNYSEDKTLLYDQPAMHQFPVAKDTMTVAPRPVHRVVRPEMPREGLKTRGEEDALRFNFLYYIIQKYKISDIIEN